MRAETKKTQQTGWKVKVRECSRRQSKKTKGRGTEKEEKLDGVLMRAGTCTKEGGGGVANYLIQEILRTMDRN